LSEFSEEQWDAFIDTDLKGMFTMVKFGVAQVPSRGVITAKRSEFGSVVMLDSPAYSNGGGVIEHTRATDVDLIRCDIRLNSLCWGATKTSLPQPEVEPRLDPDESAQEWASGWRTCALPTRARSRMAHYSTSAVNVHVQLAVARSSTADT